MDIIESIYKENEELVDFLRNKNEISFQVIVEQKFKKILLLSISSYFETKIQSILIEYTNKTNNSSEDYLMNFIKNKAINRQYHTYFDWNSNNANNFFGLFGKKFKEMITQKIKKFKLEDSVKKFLELGNLRNRLVHMNFATESIEKTSDELYNDYKEACKFINFLENTFK